MKPTKVVIIGAGNADFGPGMLADVLANPEFRGSTLSLVDIDERKLALVKAVALRMNEEWDTGVMVEAATDRRRALPEAEFVLVAIEAERMERWQMDFEVALAHGLRQPFSENGGPAGFAHGARNIAPVMGICRDMGELCPEAWFFNYTNPVPRVTLAAFKYGGIKAAGFCHGIGIGYESVSGLLDIPEEDLDIKAAGLNHFTWVLDVRRQSTGEDLPNLPHHAIVEVPAVVSAIGIRGVSVGDLPEPVAELCRRQVAVAELAVKAPATGDSRAAFHALLMDPMVTDIERGQGILDDYLKVHSDLLPQFRQ